MPREVPEVIPTRLPVVTYSDGEGTGGIGISIYRRGEEPRAAYMVVHREIRRLWESQLLERTPLEQLNDIFAIECVGPLAILATWGEMLVQELWLHFIDNAAAQQALVKGSSSTWAGDYISGETWSAIAVRRAMPWFDRVASKSNPIDGVSRGRMDGPWRSVE